MKKLAYFFDDNSVQGIELASNYVDNKVLAAGVAKSFTKPANARFCRLSAGQLFYFSVNGTAAIAGADVTNGSGSISVPATVQPMFAVSDVTAISVIAPAGCVVSAEWWG